MSEKNFPTSTKFVTLGTQVDGEAGIAASVDASRREVFWLTLEALLLRRWTKDIGQKLLGLYVHPFSHRKILMSTFHRSYRFVSSMPDEGTASLPADVKSEFVAAACMLPLARAHMRWQVSREIIATDATPHQGGVSVCIRVIEPSRAPTHSIGV